MIVTDKKYFMEKKLVEKLDLMCKRCTGARKLDNLIIIDGDEGYGKSNLLCAVAYYMAHKTGRTFDLSNIFFDPDKMVEFAISNNDKVIGWDEAAYGGLAADWQNKVQKKFLKMVMVARKKRHIYIICIPKFFKLNEYLILDRAIALLHVYARDESKLGRFVYYKKSAKERLYYDFKKTKRRNYKKYYTVRGGFRAVLPLIIDEAGYEKMKDDAMLSLLGEDKVDKHTEKMIVAQWCLATYPFGTNQDKANHVGVSVQTLCEHKNLRKKHPSLFENRDD